MTAQKAFLTLAVAAGLAGLPGCPPGRGTVPLKPPPPVGRIGYVWLSLRLPGPLNWDDRPGADGLEVQVLCFRPGSNLPVTVAGALVFDLYEGKLAGADLTKATPCRTWRFSGELLDACRARSAAGWGYALRLGWGVKAPTTSTVTLTARHVPTKGPPVHARPITVAMGPR